MAAAAAAASSSGRKRRRDSGDAPTARQPQRPACVGASVAAVEAARRGRAERAKKRRRKDQDKSARLKRQKEAARAHKEFVQTVIGAAFEGASRGAVKAALASAAEQHGVQLPLQRQGPAGAAAAAEDDGSDGDGDGDGGGVSDGTAAESAESNGDDEAAPEPEPVGVPLRDRIRALSPFAKSKKWTAEMKNLIVLCAYHHIHARHALARTTGRALKPAAGAATAAASFFGANRSRVSNVLKQFANGPINFDTPDHRFHSDEEDAARAPRPDVLDVSAQQVEAVSEFLQTRASAGSTTTWRQVYEYLKSSKYGLNLSFQLMQNRLAEHDFGVIPVRTAPVVDLTTDYWQRQRERYVMEYAAARQEELEGKAVIIFLDQSFVNLRHKRHQTVANLHASYVHTPHRSGPKAQLQTGIGRGQLLIICHAISRDGLLARLRPDGQLERPAFAADGSVLSAELIYESGKESEDYHSHFDSATFIAWAKRQLLPTALARFGPEKRLYFVLDNSGNQSAARSDYVPPKSAKPELRKVLVANGVTELEVQRKLYHGKGRGRGGRGRGAVRQFGAEAFTWFTRTLSDDQWEYPAPDGASVEELQTAVKALYKRVPRLTWSEFEVLVDAGGSAPAAGEPDTRRRGFHRVIWTPAYHSEANPIEKVWSVAKQHVAAEHTGARTMQQLRRQLLDGFYGDEKQHVGVTAESCSACVDHAEHELQQWMLRSERIRALFPGRATAQHMTLSALNERRRALYGPLVRPHRRGARNNERADAPEGAEDDGEAAIAVPPRPAAAAAAAH